MSNLPDQFSEARKAQLEAQFNFFQTLTGNAFDSVEKLFALHFDASRQSLEKSAALMRQMLSAQDPRDLFAVTKQTQSQFDSALAYSRQLFGIVAAAAPATSAAAPEAQITAVAALAPEAIASATAAAPIAEPTSIAEPTPIAKAAGTLELPMPVAASFPVPSSSKPIEVTQIKPVDAEPPPAPVSGTPEIVAKQAAAPAGKTSRKK